VSMMGNPSDSSVCRMIHASSVAWRSSFNTLFTRRFDEGVTVIRH
jgi:hypothetical protein